jgi:hypothetical protein
MVLEVSRYVCCEIVGRVHRANEGVEMGKVCQP